MKKIKKIMLVANSGKIGGGNRSLISICQELLVLGKEVRVVLPAIGVFKQELDELGIDNAVIGTSGCGRLASIKLIILQLAYVLRFGPQIIHVNDIHSFKFYGLIGKLTGIKTVCHMRHFVQEEAFNYFLSSLPDKIVFNSTYNKNKTLNNIEENKLAINRSEVIYNSFIKENYFKPDTRAEQRNIFGYTDELVVGVVGNINPGKGHIVFLKSIPAIIKNSNNNPEKLRFIFVGEDVTGSGIYKECKDLIGDLGLDKVVSFFPFQNDIAPVYAALDVLVIPSEEEPFGRVAVEGLLAKRPIAAANNSGLAEILSAYKTPVLFDVQSSEDVVTKLCGLIDNLPSSESLGIDQCMASDYFSSKEQFGQLCSAYISLFE